MIEPDLADLSAFAAVARARSFRRAAALRRVSPSSLSDALRRLEARPIATLSIEAQERHEKAEKVHRDD